MSKSYRLHNGMLVGYLIACLLAPSALTAQDNDPVPEQPSAKSDAHQTTEIVIDPSVLRGILNDPIQLISDDKKSAEDDNRRREAREESDLAAQWKMAYWAEKMFWATAVQAILAMLALFAIWRTLHWTKQAVAEASEATEAAHAAVEVTRSASEQELRAYVMVETAWLDWVGYQPIARAKIKNYGQTPARNVTHWIGAEIGEDADFSDPSEGMFKSKSDFAPGNGLKLSCHYDPIDTQTHNRIIKREIPIYVFGEIQYDDVFGKKRITSFRMMLNRDPGRHENSRELSACAQGNSYT